MRLIIYVVLLCLSVCDRAFAQDKKGPVYQFTSQVAIELVNDLLTGITPDRPENVYMPEFLKEKIRWLYAEEATKRLELKFTSDDQGLLGQTLMRAYYLNGKPIVEIVANRLVMLIRIQEHVMTHYSRMQKNTFAVGLAHETVHLERPPRYFTVKNQTRSTFIAEEFRTVEKIDRLVVQPLLAKAEPIDVDFVDLNRILKKCDHKLPCQSFVDYYIDGKRSGAQDSGKPIGPRK